MVTRIFAPEPSAASLRLEALARALSKVADVTILTTLPPGDVHDAEADGTDIRRWPVLRDRSGYVRGYLQYMSFDLPLLLRVLFGRRADVYVCEPPPTTGAVVRIAAKLRRRPYVYYAADIWSDAAQATSAPRFIVRILAAMERFAMRGADALLVVTPGVESRVHDLAPGRYVRVVGHGVDLSTFAPDGETVPAPADIVYVGSASEWHGASVAMEAVIRVLERDPLLTAAFIGQGSEWSQLRDLAARSSVNSRVRFLDTVPAERAADWLRSARVAVATLAPAQGYDFAVPTKLYAAVAVGTPVAYAGPDPVRGIINRDRLGVGVDHDAVSLADAVSQVLTEDFEDERDRLVRWAEDNVSAERVAERATAAIVAIADGSQGATQVPH
ncbi:glycosyltransferase family 4 protein [Microbacterium sp. OR21]|uniref:glycosyltransferase family 4 protein n=1 Tax=Microbacterium sp. OR21 TaxID=3095346 RepID=UPI0039B3FF1B